MPKVLANTIRKQKEIADIDWEGKNKKKEKRIRLPVCSWYNYQCRKLEFLKKKGLWNL